MSQHDLLAFPKIDISWDVMDFFSLHPFFFFFQLFFFYWNLLPVSFWISQSFFFSCPILAFSGFLYQLYTSIILVPFFEYLPSPLIPTTSLFQLQFSRLEILFHFAHALVNVKATYRVFFASQMITHPYFSLILGFLSCTFGFCHILSSSFLYCFIAGRFCRLFIDQLSLIFSSSL